MKVLVLILSSPDTNSIYKLHKEVWLEYMNSHKDIECYFIEYNPNENYVNDNILINNNTISINGTESMNPGCRDKTFYCFDYFLNKKNASKYDFIIRTNMSSLWNFNSLIKYLDTLPRNKVYSGVIGYCSSINISFASGSGIIMTPDIVELIINNKHLAYNCNWMDDVDIAYILYHLNITPSPSSRTDIYSLEMYNNYTFDKNAYHYRIRWDNESLRYEEPTVMRQILKMINNDANC